MDSLPRQWEADAADGGASSEPNPPRGERKHANKGLMGKRWCKRRRGKRMKGTLSLREKYLDFLKEIRGKLSRISAQRLGFLVRLHQVPITHQLAALDGEVRHLAADDFNRARMVEIHRHLAPPARARKHLCERGVIDVQLVPVRLHPTGDQPDFADDAVGAIHTHCEEFAFWGRFLKEPSGRMGGWENGGASG